MSHNESILQTKLLPPRIRQRTLTRPRVDKLLREALDYRLTLVQAGTGFGKSTALAHLAHSSPPCFWYSASDGDGDPRQFMIHLFTAFRLLLPGLPNTPHVLLQNPQVDAPKTAMIALINVLSGELATASLLVVDDYHLAASKEVDALVQHLISFLPNDLHVIISTRYTPEWENLISWRARGDLREIKRDELAFTRDEIAALFRDKYDLALSAKEVALLDDRTEGWPIALQLVWQEFRDHPRSNLETLLRRGSGSLETLFSYLARAVLTLQSSDTQSFLLQTSVLRELEPAACQAVTGADAGPLLARLQERDLFVVATGGIHYRYHHLFHDFLREQALRQDAAEVSRRHRLAGDHYRRAGQFDEAVYHYLQAGAFADAASLIEQVGEGVLRAGRLDTLAAWIDAIPPEQVAANPALMFYLGDLARLRSRFDDGLAWYAQAERAWQSANDVRGMARALRGQALVYLDTVRPSRAEDLLQKALRLTDRLDDRAARAQLLELLAENKLNMGKAGDAERLREQARELREEGPSEDVLSVRVKLRTGRLDEAREILEIWAQQERGRLHPPRAHRETLLVLSLIHSMQGRAAEAFDTAQESIALAEQLSSPYVLTAGKLRLGHAYQVRGELPQAIRCYEEAIALSAKIAVPRSRAEALLGIARARGLAGDLDSARRAALEGIEIARNAGDIWVAALLQLCLGSSQVMAGEAQEALGPIADALAAFRDCGDAFGITASQTWLAFAHWNLRQRDRAAAFLDEALGLAQTYHYDCLFVRRTLFGWPDTRALVPLLIEMRKQARHAAYVTSLFAVMGLERVTVHAGYQLCVHTLGTFRVLRGKTEITTRWRRHKARELLQLLVTCRGRLLEREEILDLLWPGESPAAATRDFKVALNALNKVLEPDRTGEDEPAFIARQESAYGLRPDADIWIDADEFAGLVARADAASGEAALDLYRRAMPLYQDDYMASDARYADWAVAERERLLALFLHAADRLASELLEQNNLDECLTWCERIVARDRCWEHAYRLAMQAYLRRGEVSNARRAFEQCTRALRKDLDAEPSPATWEVFRQV